MSGAEVLREAAHRIRLGVEMAQLRPGRWSVDVAGPLASTGWLGPSHDVLTATWRQAQHVSAFGSPAVALAVAAWLDDVAENGTSRISFALAVARAYLGTEPDAPARPDREFLFVDTDPIGDGPEDAGR